MYVNRLCVLECMLVDDLRCMIIDVSRMRDKTWGVSIVGTKNIGMNLKNIKSMLQMLCKHFNEGIWYFFFFLWDWDKWHAFDVIILHYIVIIQALGCFTLLCKFFNERICYLFFLFVRLGQVFELLNILQIYYIKFIYFFVSWANCKNNYAY
jgi:hypothetical protein